MHDDGVPLGEAYRGWDDQHTSLVRTLERLGDAQLGLTAAPGQRTAGELFGHIVGGRINWLHRVLGLGRPDLLAALEGWGLTPGLERDAAGLLVWLRRSWEPAQQALDAWTVADLTVTLDLPYEGRMYRVPRQWVLWRIMSHDTHHGGELALLLGMHGVAVPELGDEGGHLAVPPLA